MFLKKQTMLNLKLIVEYNSLKDSKFLLMLLIIKCKTEKNLLRDIDGFSENH